MHQCIECGSDLLEEHPAGHGRVLECSLCGELSGDDEVIGRILGQQEAAARGMDPRVFEMVTELEAIDGIRVDRFENGDSQNGTWPVLFVHPGSIGLRWLEPLAKSFTLAAQLTRHRWTLEVLFQRHLELHLRPRISPTKGQISAGDLEACRADLGTLAAALRRDRRLSWWRPAFKAKNER